LTINIKFKKPIASRNYTHWIFCTNSDNPIKIDEDDRRYSVFYSEKLRKGLGTTLRQNIDYEVQDFICYLKDLDVKFEEVEEPIHTSAKDEIIDLNKDSVSMFKEYLSQFTTLFEAYVSLFGYVNNDVFINDDETGEKYILTDIMYTIYQKYCEVYKERGVFKKQNFSKKMSVYGTPPVAKWLNNKTKKVFNVEIIEKNLIKNEVKNDN